VVKFKVPAKIISLIKINKLENHSFSSKALLNSECLIWIKITQMPYDKLWIPVGMGTSCGSKYVIIIFHTKSR
jgi:hypothetical protein